MQFNDTATIAVPQSASKTRPKSLFEIRNMNANSKKALSALMNKMGAACNMIFNEERQCWEGPPEDSIAEQQTAGIGRFIQESSDLSGIGSIHSFGSLDDRALDVHVDDIDSHQQAYHEHSPIVAFSDLVETRSDSSSVQKVALPASQPFQHDIEDIDKKTNEPELSGYFEPTGLSFLKDIDSALHSLEQIQIPAELQAAHPHTLACSLSPPPGDRRTLAINAVPSLQQILEYLDNNRQGWTHTLDLSLDDSDLSDVKGLDALMPNLLRLSLNGNNITYLDGIPNCITTLVVKNNRLSNITSFSHLKHLKYADMSFNNISELESLKCLSSLCELNVSGNLITEATLQKSDFVALTCMDLSQNQLQTLTVQGGASPSLQCLYIDKNALTSLQVASETLRKLHAEQNELKLEGLDLSECPQLRILNLGFNQIANMPGKLPNGVEELYLHHQKGLDVRFTGFGNFQPIRLKILYVSGTPIDSLNIFFPCRATLQTLVAKRCLLKCITQEFAQSMECVKTLKVAHNKIPDISCLKYMQTLITLDLSSNDITNFKRTLGVLHRLRYLEHLDLRYNPITESFYPPLQPIRPSHGLGGGGLVGEPVPVPSANNATAGFAHLDRRFQRELSDEVYIRRVCYRAVVVRGTAVRMLDGIVMDGRERRKADICLKVVMKAS
ncbi:hypothetical protein BC830DRAFT_1123991 [Chytriomyces sp. MP71]|nr:hypothetical protein BC830DRAFT_1123991 [Chytriomyces sp. MP71]